MAERRGRARSLIHGYGTVRRASWLELYFDLTFVAAVFRISRLFIGNPTLHGVEVYCRLLAVIWWLWLSFSYFADLFDDDTPPARLSQMAAMLGVLFLAVFVGRGLSVGNTSIFAVTYALLLLLLAGLYASAGWVDPQVREFCSWYVVGYLVGALVWLGSLLVAPHGRFWVWMAALVVNAVIAGPLAYARVRHPPTQVSHMSERLGLFMIVVLGDAVLATVIGLDSLPLTPEVVTIGICGFVIASAIWWVYFTAAFDREAMNRLIRGERRALVRSFLHIYGYLIVYAGIVGTGLGIELAVEDSVHHIHGIALPLLGGSTLVVEVGAFVVFAGARLPVSRRGMVSRGVLIGLALVVTLDLPSLALGVVLVALGWVLLAVMEQTAPIERPGGALER